MLARIRQVMPAKAARNTNLFHMSWRISWVAYASTPALFNLSTISSATGSLAVATGPVMTVMNDERCSITPSGRRLAAPWMMPPSKRRVRIARRQHVDVAHAVEQRQQPRLRRPAAV